jgi:hypothetical protein
MTYTAPGVVPSTEQFSTLLNLHSYYVIFMGYIGAPVRRWLRRYATSRKIKGLSPVGITGFFQCT